MAVSSLWDSLTRCKTINRADPEKSQLARVLGLPQLYGIGVGSTFGLGVYIVSGLVARTTAGPAVILSFCIAAIVVVLAAMCFAELGSRIPTSGSIYVYTYVSLGELAAFTLGWYCLFSGIVGTASLAKGISHYIDTLMGNVRRNYFMEIMPMNYKYLAEYPDFFAFAIIVVISLIAAFGVKNSTRLSNTFTVLNLLTIATVIIAGATKIDLSNWKINVDNITEEYKNEAGNGGFIPFGFQGIIEGSSKCFFAFSGFEVITATGDEAKNPKRNIPMAIVMTIFTALGVYISLSSITTLVWPYYSQDINAPYPYIFEELGMPIVKWIVTIGAVFAMSSCLMGSIFSLPRILYSMGCDGVIFRGLSNVNAKTQTPIWAILTIGTIASISTMLFNLDQLMDMASSLGLLNYTIAPICVLVLRYKNDASNNAINTDLDCPDRCTYTPWSMLKFIFNLHGAKNPTDLSCRIAKTSIFLFVMMAIGCCTSFVWISHAAINTLATTMFAVLCVLLWIIIARQPTYSVEHLTIKIPFVATLVCFICIANIFLMIQLQYIVWIKHLIWLSIGYIFYFSYGIRNSLERKIRATENNSKM